MGRIEIILHNHLRAWVAECSNPGVIYLGVLGLFVIGAFLFSNTSINANVGGTAYERRRVRRCVGGLIMFAAVMGAGIEILSQATGPTSNLPPISIADRSEAAAATPPARAPLPLTSNASASYSPPTSTAQPETTPVSSLPHSPSQPSSGAPVSDYSSPVSASPSQPQADPVAALMSQAFQLMQQQQLDAALDKANAAVQAAPQNADAYGLRGAVYAEKKAWDQAEKDYQTSLQLDGNNVHLKFDFAEVQFMQQKYDAARPGFVALEQDPNMGDLAEYKAFLCDLFGAHEEAASKELDNFNQTGSNASYYFANAAWDLYHKKPDDARGWLMSATKIYQPPKFKRYASSLISLGYMPLPPPPPPQ